MIDRFLYDRSFLQFVYLLHILLSTTMFTCFGCLCLCTILICLIIVPRPPHLTHLSTCSYPSCPIPWQCGHVYTRSWYLLDLVYAYGSCIAVSVQDIRINVMNIMSLFILCLKFLFYLSSDISHSSDDDIFSSISSIILFTFLILMNHIITDAIIINGQKSPNIIHVIHTALVLYAIFAALSSITFFARNVIIAAIVIHTYINIIVYYFVLFFRISPIIRINIHTKATIAVCMNSMDSSISCLSPL